MGHGPRISAPLRYQEVRRMRAETSADTSGVLKEVRSPEQDTNVFRSREDAIAYI